MKTIQFVSRTDAEKIQDTEGKGIVSITTPGDDWPNIRWNAWESFLLLKFHDTDYALEGFVLFGRDQATRIIEWMNENEQIDSIVVHCDAGVCRSAAVAKFIAERQDRKLLGNEVAPSPHWMNRYVYKTLCRTADGETDYDFIFREGS